MNENQMQKYLEWRNTECGKEVAAFAESAIEQVVRSNFNDLEVVRPANMHVMLGLMGSMLPPQIGNILRDLSTWFYENPDEAAKAWESVKESVDPLNKRGWNV